MVLGLAAIALTLLTAGLFVAVFIGIESIRVRRIATLFPSTFPTTKLSIAFRLLLTPLSATVPVGIKSFVADVSETRFTTGIHAEVDLILLYDASPTGKGCLPNASRGTRDGLGTVARSSSHVSVLDISSRKYWIELDKRTIVGANTADASLLSELLSQDHPSVVADGLPRFGSGQTSSF